MTTADSIIMSKVADIVTSPSGGINDFLKVIVPKLPAIILMVVVKKCIDNAGDFFYSSISNLGCLLRKLFYN